MKQTWRIRALVMVLAVLSVAACSDTLTNPALHGPTTSDRVIEPPTQGGGDPGGGDSDSTGAMYVSLTPTKVTESGPVTIKAMVQGGVPPYRYYWGHAYCINVNSGSSLSCGTLYMDTQSTSSDSLPLWVNDTDAFVEVAVIVSDASDVTQTAQTLRYVFGPAAGAVSEPDLSHCVSEDNPDVYPFWTPLPPDPTTQTGYYRIDPCNGNKIYQEKPQN